MSLKFRWLGTVCLEIVLASGKVIVVDPYLDSSPTSPIKSSDMTGADYIAITHGHVDHFADAGLLAHKFNSTVICSRSIATPLARFMNVDFDTMVKVTAGDRIEFSDFWLEVKKADHVSTLGPLKEAYRRKTGHEPPPDMPAEELFRAVYSRGEPNPDPAQDKLRRKVEDAGITIGEQVSYVFQTPDNLRLYVHGAGPYDYLRSIIKESRSHVFFAQLGGVRSEVAAEIAALSGAPIVVPVHHDMDGPEVMHKRALSMAHHLAALSPHARLVDVEPGKWYEIKLTAEAL